MNIKCKCGRNTNYGMTCTFCRPVFDLDPDLEEIETVEDDLKLSPVDEQLQKEYGDILGLDHIEQEEPED